MRNGQSGGAISQHLAKDCSALKENGVKVPSPLKRGGNRNGRHEHLSFSRLAPVASKVSTPFGSGFDSLSEHISVGMSQALLALLSESDGAADEVGWSLGGGFRRGPTTRPSHVRLSGKLIFVPSLWIWLAKD